MEYAEKIRELVRQSHSVIASAIQDASLKDAACLDGLTTFGDINVAGGGIFLLKEGWLERFFYYRQGASGKIYVHWYCGYMFVELGLTTLAEHQTLIAELESEVARLNREYGCHYEVVVEHDGGAKSHMGY